ncbi:winged helix-turn-helix transcriptional regulator [archaeon]|nr:winged helix-turn-helix transcriptional regulator [archaeon]
MAETLDKTALKALSADTRQSIIKMLLKRPYTASEISKILNKHVTTVAEHLNILESAGLIKKKDSTNKWIYYTLTEKGEKLFKPSYYSWIVVLSLSVVFVFTGFLRFFSSGASYYTASTVQSEALVAKAADTAAQVPTPSPIDIIAILLIVLGILGFAYLCYRVWKRKRLQKEMKMYVEYAVL